MIRNGFSSLARYCNNIGYRGWDVFDGLNSRIFQISPFYRYRLFRLAWIQIFKRSPINLRSICFVPKGFNPKGLGLFASGLIDLKRFEEAELLLNLLLNLQCNENRGAAWGYNFPWQARAFYVPAGSPNMVATVFVANAFLDFYESTENHEFLKIAERTCEFILDSLILFEDKDSLCFAYIPNEDARVHNANMLGASLLARVSRYSGKKELYEKSTKAMIYSMKALTKEYYWPYGELPHHRFIDSLHTGFNLVALKGWMDYTGEKRWERELKKAYDQYLKSFWTDNGCPKYYHNRLYPIDIHCSAQGIITCLSLCEYSDRGMPFAKKIAEWAVKNMQDRQGYFYYQKTKLHINKIPYIRWSQAWMFRALALYIKKIGSTV